MAETIERSRQEARREKMIAAARKLFVEKGFEATSLDDIIAETGGSRRNVYLEFGGKEGLLRAVIEQIVSGIARDAALPDEEVLAPRDWLIAVGTAFVTRLLSPEVTAVFRQFIATGGADRDTADLLWQAGPMRLRKVLEHWLTEQASAGALDVPDPAFVARILPEMLRGGLQVELLIGRRPTVSEAEIRRQVEQATDFALAAMAPRGSRRDGTGPDR
ncbi:TetR/AcrR family transcriptional regulator [Sulfitobacter sp. D35]|uniref:TetR/AcrR family transcriptional regulator n=1 Tax=Sulfitobacter sp. D35 TaxID=3083252 RepID=UPI0029700495|nr:TetR/AcrR family transcriptional regulator [Sulfitobacter sp. D35]MDW4499344.1 TetR/AcrR family transcriptional regulator [Sulfitobacter sp. D35]